MAVSQPEVLQAVLDSQRNCELSIIKISKPISSAINSTSATRTSDVSTDSYENPTPTSLEADLAHYKELFSKLRFSYLEQVTKEKFIRAIVGDPPLVVTHQENVELEAQLATVKTALKTQKTEVADLVAKLEGQGRELSRTYDSIQLQTTQLQELPRKVEELQVSILELKAGQAPRPDPLMNMSLEKTLIMLEEKERERGRLDRQLDHLQTALPRKIKDLEMLEAELQPLEVKRLGSMASAQEAQRRKEDALGGASNDLEERGRWWRGVESGLRGMLRVED
ncbi:MAG: hypothetical protein M1818_008295 [Claussenomyces sp. TS43310]|nr:MAG: hypothetical protein M1818_008295 [Claussenomyces sp. TS43310]